MEVSTEVIYNSVSLFEVFVGPSCECILLYSFPLSVYFERAFGVGHGDLPFKGVVGVVTVVVLCFRTPSGQETESGRLVALEFCNSTSETWTPLSNRSRSARCVACARPRARAPMHLFKVFSALCCIHMDVLVRIVVLALLDKGTLAWPSLSKLPFRFLASSEPKSSESSVLHGGVGCLSRGGLMCGRREELRLLLVVPVVRVSQTVNVTVTTMVITAAPMNHVTSSPFKRSDK